MHDDQHGTAVVVLAGLINAFKVTGRKIEKVKIVISGAGAAGTAIAKLLKLAGASDIVVLDSKGIIGTWRTDLNAHKQELAGFTNSHTSAGGLSDALVGADVFIGVSGPNLATATDIALMVPKAIVFALANPTPEIMPDEAKRGGAAVIATGRSDFSNQINNSLAFPGIFRGALDHKVRRITDEMKLKAAKAIAALVKYPTATKIVPDMFDKKVPIAVAKVIR
jgi:malate dehydrogenase (oxaloacetate-decarboxylating)